jgi:hypothetical protein
MNANDLSVDVIMLATPEAAGYAWLAKRTWKNYCERHGHRLTIFKNRLIPDMHINWSKIEAMRLTLANSDRAYVLLVDADLVVLRPELPLSDLADRTRDIVFASDKLFGSFWPDMRHAVLKWKLGMATLPNAGFMLARRNDWAISLFEQWLELARGDLLDWADRHPRNQNVLWRGLLPTQRHRIAILGDEIVRITHARQIPRVAHCHPFAVHFRHERVRVNDVLPLVPKDR